MMKFNTHINKKRIKRLSGIQRFAGLSCSLVAFHPCSEKHVKFRNFIIRVIEDVTAKLTYMIENNLFN